MMDRALMPPQVEVSGESHLAPLKTAEVLVGMFTYVSFLGG